VWERFATAIKIDRIPFFNAYSPPEEDSLVSFIDLTGRFWASGDAYRCHPGRQRSLIIKIEIYKPGIENA